MRLFWCWGELLLLRVACYLCGWVVGNALGGWWG